MVPKERDRAGHILHLIPNAVNFLDEGMFCLVRLRRLNHVILPSSSPLISLLLCRRQRQITYVRREPPCLQTTSKFASSPCPRARVMCRHCCTPATRRSV